MPRGGKTAAAIAVAGVALGVPARQAEAADGPWRGEFRSGEYSLQAVLYGKKCPPITKARPLSGRYTGEYTGSVFGGDAVCSVYAGRLTGL